MSIQSTTDIRMSLCENKRGPTFGMRECLFCKFKLRRGSIQHNSVFNMGFGLFFWGTRSKTRIIATLHHVTNTYIRIVQKLRSSSQWQMRDRFWALLKPPFSRIHPWLWKSGAVCLQRQTVFCCGPMFTAKSKNIIGEENANSIVCLPNSINAQFLFSCSFFLFLPITDADNLKSFVYGCTKNLFGKRTRCSTFEQRKYHTNSKRTWLHFDMRQTIQL